ncbi:hypothetical protein FE257_007472 [Aspergillus nanangensis]|uniref:Uncharacterized protein n=1 Tax=Aspergillus nanangensis TaxID=2582783 RepID=A0AAD4GU47_ASPNN|nr:hypothetical protein FE257_007472 [Aspergillus nanangensis]
MIGLVFKPLHPTFGAECEGYGVLIFRRTQLNDSQQEDFARQFGEMDVSAVPASSSERKPRLAPDKQLVDMSNMSDDGGIEPKNSLGSGWTSRCSLAVSDAKLNMYIKYISTLEVVYGA